ncbi:MAG: HD domain-containing protein [Lachnospiraceae bacterium]|nr:HD domain-containing protein [Lachnospiraceae bacterium]
MDRVNQILKHSLFNKYMQANAARETERIFCKHDMAHVMDVARIAYILNMEEEYRFSKELIYGAALLHDIGRHVQYDTGEKHAVVSARLAPVILQECGYDSEEIQKIVSAIATHSDKSLIDERNLNGLLARADQISRACYNCRAVGECDWSDERKNYEISL